jgi:hypothetical protein
MMTGLIFFCPAASYLTSLPTYPLTAYRYSLNNPPTGASI